MKLKPYFFCFFFLLVIPRNMCGQDFKIDTTKLSQFLHENFNKKKFNGIALIAYKNEVVYRKSYGYSNIEKKKVFSNTTKFQIASLSKQFTSSGIMILEQENKLNIEDFVSKYLVDFPYRNIKIKHLMSHTSGLPNFVRTMWKDLDTTVVNGNNEMLSLLKLKKYPLQWEPGSKFQYSDIGYCTLASLIEKVSEKRFDVFMKENIFEPAKMTNTTAELVTDYREIKATDLSMGYYFDTKMDSMKIAYKAPKNSFVYWLGGFYGDGSVVSTVDDLLKWDKVLSEGKIITSESLKRMVIPTLLNNGKMVEIHQFSYGLGWFLGDSSNFGKIETHAGGQPGYSSRLTRCPDNELTIIILANMSIPSFWKFSLLKELENQQ